MLLAFDQAEDENDQVDALVSLIHDQYLSCGFKPSNTYQFTILAAFVLSNHSSNESNVISLATGSKCLPTSKYPPKGDALHDSHAEVLARRGAIRWLYEELRRCISMEYSSTWIKRSPKDCKWTLAEDVSLHLYISTLPCGDASMQYLASIQSPEIAVLKDSSTFPILPPNEAARGRDNYSLFGVLRTKPGRADSPATLCMSCSDKIASWNVLGIQGALATKFFEPIYVSAIIIGEIDMNERLQTRKECERAFYGRLAGVEARLPAGFKVSQPKILFSSRPFPYSRSSLEILHAPREIDSSSNDSLCFVADSKFHHEVIINGSRRGVQAKMRGLLKYRPQLCKVALFDLYHELLVSLGQSSILSINLSYFDAKKFASQEYQLAKSALKGHNAPFSGWRVSGKPWESFNIEGAEVESTEVNQ